MIILNQVLHFMQIRLLIKVGGKYEKVQDHYSNADHGFRFSRM